ncbi:MAG: iron-sulfur cluster assembly scaffold protein [Bacteroidales bacterium]|nr:iron-sulfur cluster assembly scaffold protein [Bacteroidales bacterium]
MDDLLKDAGYSNKAIEYYTKKVNVGKIVNPSVELSYTGSCGDTMKMYLTIDSDVIKEAKFEAIGCAGAFSAGSALLEMIKGKYLIEAENINTEDIIEHLGGVPDTKIDCVRLAIKTFEKTLQLFKEKNQS